MNTIVFLLLIWIPLGFILKTILEKNSFNDFHHGFKAVIYYLVAGPAEITVLANNLVARLVTKISPTFIFKVKKFFLKIP